MPASGPQDLRRLSYTVESVDIAPDIRRSEQCRRRHPCRRCSDRRRSRPTCRTLWSQLANEVTAKADTPAAKAAAIQAYPAQRPVHLQHRAAARQRLRGAGELPAARPAGLLRAVRLGDGDDGPGGRHPVPGGGRLPAGRAGSGTAGRSRSATCTPGRSCTSPTTAGCASSRRRQRRPGLRRRGPCRTQATPADDPSANPPSEPSIDQSAPGDEPSTEPSQQPTDPGTDAGRRLGTHSARGPAIVLVLLLILAAPATIRVRRRSNRLNGSGRGRGAGGGCLGRDQRHRGGLRRAPGPTARRGRSARRSLQPARSARRPSR